MANDIVDGNDDDDEHMMTGLLMMIRMMMMLCSRSQGKEKEAETLLKDSIRYGPHFADAYSSLASLYAEQVKQRIHTYKLVAHLTYVPEGGL